MTIVLLVAALIGALSFGCVVFVGAPFVPTLKPQITTAFELLDLKPGQTLLELGSGDGRVLVAAAERGLHVVGYELNPLLVIVSWMRTRRYRKQVKIVWGNFWRTWPPADGIFIFLLPRYMDKLDKTIEEWRHTPVRLASFAFAVPNKRPAHQKRGVFLYEYR